MGRGDRVGVFLPKGPEAVAAIHGVLRSGAAYVPVDATASAVRGAGILADAGVKAVVVAADLTEGLRQAWAGSGPLPRRVVVGDPGGLASSDAAWDEVLGDSAPSPLPPRRDPDDVAYILYTSGSTGRPKGVMLTHANAFAFLDWCHRTLPLRTDDRFSSHAPFHFDLSVFDLFASCRQGATLVLIGEALGKDPIRLGTFLAGRRVDVWYSAPSILALLTQYGGLERQTVAPPGSSCSRARSFRSCRCDGSGRPGRARRSGTSTGRPRPTSAPRIRSPRRSPTTASSPTRSARSAPHRGRVVDERGRDVAPGTIGELVIAGPGVMRGYFGQPDLTAHAFLRDGDGTAWYRTGDLVVDDGAGCFTFHGRRDRMVKRRGYRIELGEIESALYRHEGVDRAAVVAKPDDAGVSIAAFVAMRPGAKGSIIAMKRHCTIYLPHYMVPDSITFVSDLPTTSTDKVDYQDLKRLAADRA